MKNTNIILGIMIYISLLSGEESFTIKLDEQQTIQPLLNIVTSSGAMNFGQWSYNSGTDFFLRVNSATVDLTAANERVNFTLETTAYMNINVSETIDLEHEGNITIYLSGSPLIEYYSESGRCRIVFQNISISFESGEWPDWMIAFANFSAIYAVHFSNMFYFNLVEFYPNLSQYYFQSSLPEITVTDDAILISVFLNLELELANKSIANPIGYLNGRLSLQNIDTPELTQTNKPSPSLSFARLNDDYVATTHDRIIGNEVHLSWTNNIDHKLTTDQFLLLQEYFNEGVIAWYEEQRTITITSNLEGAGLDFHDPWYYDETTQTQPDEFLPISPGQYYVFLEQNPDFQPNQPIYRLKAAASYATGTVIYAFDHWDGRDISFGNSNNRETMVVFHSGDATAEAVYVNALTGAGVQVNVASDETLIIPAGGTYQWDYTAFNFRFDVEGSLIMEGSEQDWITFSPTGGTSFMIGGIHVDNGGTLICDYVDFDYSQYALTGDAIIVDNGDAQITNCRFTNILTDAIDIHSNATAFIANSEIISYGGSGVGIECIVTHGSGHTVKLWNNTIVDFSTGIAATVTETENGPAFDMRNNIIYYGLTPNSGTVGIEDNITNFLYTELDYNLIYGFASSGTVNIPEAYIHHLIETLDPGFVNYSSGDFTLSSASPCIDTGEMDLDGDGDIWNVDPDDQDPDGTRMDMGVYYFDAVPATPTNFSISGSVGQHPTLHWTLSPDADISEYEIWRRLTEGDSQYSLRSTVSNSTSEYIDTEITINAGGKRVPRACYRVRAVDNIDQMSPFTNIMCTYYGAVGKMAEELLPQEYAVHANYPNPFNPSTVIPYDLPEDSRVSIKIYDFLGREICTLVNGVEAGGFKEVVWDGTSATGRPVAAGMYLLTVRLEGIEGDQRLSATRKLILIK